MNIVHISKIQETIKENNDHVIFIIHSKEAHKALCKALEEAECYWSGMQPATADTGPKRIPGGIRVEGNRLKQGMLGDYESGYLLHVPRFRVVL